MVFATSGIEKLSFPVFAVPEARQKHYGRRKYDTVQIEFDKRVSLTKIVKTRPWPVTSFGPVHTV